VVSVIDDHEHADHASDRAVDVRRSSTEDQDQLADAARVAMAFNLRFGYAYESAPVSVRVKKQMARAEAMTLRARFGWHRTGH
jgi:hypothetical protein